MIYISAGHHSAAQGACYEGVCEYELAVQWAAVLYDIIGDNARLVPPGTLRTKVEFINRHAKPADVAIEIHFNSAVADGKNVGRGCETLYAPGDTTGAAIAAKVQSAMASVIQPDRGHKEGWYRMQQRFGPDFFLAQCRCIALIIEPEFIHRMDIINAKRVETCAAIAASLLPPVAR